MATVKKDAKGLYVRVGTAFLRAPPDSSVYENDVVDAFVLKHPVSGKSMKIGTVMNGNLREIWTVGKVDVPIKDE